jgi:rSAM/selenodomain-associated transferase 1
MIADVQILVLAKAPEPGHAKTRLSPPLTLAEAAHLAGAALKDTLAAVACTRAGRRALVLDGPITNMPLDGFDVIPQRGDGLAARIAAAFEDAGAPALLIAMDTPQITPDLLERSCSLLLDPAVDAVIGPAHDGGYWGIGMKEVRPDVFLDVPMSTSTTLRAQRERLAIEGLRCRSLPMLRDVDEFQDAWAVAAAKPGSDFAYALAEVTARSGINA